MSGCCLSLCARVHGASVRAQAEVFPTGLLKTEIIPLLSVLLTLVKYILL